MRSICSSVAGFAALLVASSASAEWSELSLPLPDPAPALLQRGPVDLRVVDLRPSAAGDPGGVDIGERARLDLPWDVRGLVSELVRRRGRAEGIWPRPLPGSLTRGGHGHGHGGALHRLDVTIGALACAPDGGSQRCAVVLSLRLGDTHAALDGTRVEAVGRGQDARRALGEMLLALDGSLTSELSGLATSLPPRTGAPSPIPRLTLLSWAEDDGEYAGLGLWQGEGGWCAVDDDEGHLRWLPSETLLSQAQTDLPFAEPGDLVVWAENWTQVYLVHEVLGDERVAVRIEGGLALLSRSEVGALGVYAGPWEPGVCEGSIARELEALRVARRGAALAVDREEGQSIARLVRERGARIGRAELALGIASTITGAFLLVSSSFATVDACFRVPQPCNSHPQAIVTVPLGGLSFLVGLPLTVGGAIRWKRSARDAHPPSP